MNAAKLLMPTNKRARVEDKEYVPAKSELKAIKSKATQKAAGKAAGGEATGGKAAKRHKK